MIVTHDGAADASDRAPILQGGCSSRMLGGKPPAEFANA
jgi:hypothetical protein